MLRKLWLVLLLGLAAPQLWAGPPPPAETDPRVRRITADLMKSDVLGFQAGISKQNIIDWLGVPTASAGCPPPGQARSFYDQLLDVWKVIDSNCHVIISGGGGGSSVAWNQLLNPTGGSSPNFGGNTFTFANGVWNWGTMTVLAPAAASFLGTTQAQIGYDTTNNNLHFYTTNDNIVGLFPVTTAFMNGDLVGVSLNGGQVSLTDVSVNGSGGSGNTFQQFNVTNPVIGQTFCIDSVTGTQYTASNCSPGIPVDLETTNYVVDPINDRGVAIVENSSTSPIITYNQAFGDAGCFDANWFNFDINKGVSPTTLLITSPSIWDSTGTQTEVLQPGQQMSVITDTTSGIAYPKAHEPRMAPGPGISFDRSNPYLLTVSSTPASTFTGNQVISGCGVSWTSGLTFEVQACTYQIAGVTYTTAETSETLSAASVTNPRFDVIYVNASSAVAVQTGTPAANPQIPTVDPTVDLPLTSILVPTSATQPNVGQVIIYQNDAGPPTEWTCTSTSNINCASTNNPYSIYTHSVEATTAVTTNNSTFTIGSGSVNLANYNVLVFFIRNKAAWAAAKSIQIFWKNGSVNVGTAVTFKNGIYGFAQTNTTTYQEIVIPLTAFGTGTNVVTNLEMEVLGGGAGIGYYLGNIQLQNGFNGGGGAGGGSAFQLQVDGTQCQTPCNLQDSASVTFAQSVSGGVTNITATAVGAPPSGTAGGDLSGTYPNPTVAKVDGVSYGASPSTNTVPVVTGSNTVTYEQVPNAALANPSVTVGGQTCTLGSSCTPHVNHGLSFTIGQPGGTALVAGSSTTDYITVPFACTINAYDLSIDAGTITVKFWKVGTGTAIPTSGNSISTSGVSISSGTHIHSTTLSDFTTTAVTAFDVMALNVSTTATAAYINGVLACQE